MLTINNQLIQRSRKVLDSLLNENLDKYIDMFFYEKPVELRKQDATMLLEAGIVRAHGVKYIANVMLFPYKGKLITTDFLLSIYKRDPKGRYLRGLDDVWVMFPHETLLFIDNLDPINGNLALDIASGSGAISLFLADRFEKVIASDINPKAVAYARFNAVLNNAETKITNIQSDIFSSLQNHKFDYVCWNGPTVALPEVESPTSTYPLYTYGGFDGAEFTRKFLTQVPEHLQHDFRIKWWDGSLGDKESSVVEKFIRVNLKNMPIKVTIQYLNKTGGAPLINYDRMYIKYNLDKFELNQNKHTEAIVKAWYDKLKTQNLTQVYISLISIEKADKFSIAHKYPEKSKVTPRHVFGFEWHAVSREYIRNYITSNRN